MSSLNQTVTGQFRHKHNLMLCCEVMTLSKQLISVILFMCKGQLWDYPKGLVTQKRKSLDADLRWIAKASFSFIDLLP